MPNPDPFDSIFFTFEACIVRLRLIVSFCSETKSSHNSVCVIKANLPALQNYLPLFLLLHSELVLLCLSETQLSPVLFIFSLSLDLFSLIP